MKKFIFLLFLVFIINSCTNRYEEQNNIAKNEAIQQAHTQIKSHYKKKKRRFIKKSIKKRKKYAKAKLKKQTSYKIEKKLLEPNYLEYSSLQNNFFNNKLMLDNLITKKKTHKKKKYLTKHTKKVKKILKKRKPKTIKHYAKKASKKNIKKSKHKKKLYLTATAYTSHKNQTDSTPFLAAWNNKIKPGMKIVAVSHDLIKKHGLKNGVKVKIKGLKGHYVVKDKMNKRYKKRIDIYMGLNKKRALRWGKRKVVLYY